MFKPVSFVIDTWCIGGDLWKLGDSLIIDSFPLQLLFLGIILFKSKAIFIVRRILGSSGSDYEGEKK